MPPPLSGLMPVGAAGFLPYRQNRTRVHSRRVLSSKTFHRSSSLNQEIAFSIGTVSSYVRLVAGSTAFAVSSMSLAYSTWSGPIRRISNSSEF
jgi:hypothetical protein